ncbi:MAG: ABC transporter substrate-binding protein [Rhodospirillales bacterium]|nr:ABC transporter substrate-binding protein [Rhodospirillales bacterium]
MRFVFAFLVALIVGPGTLPAAQPKPVHGLAMHGQVKYGPDFTHFDYVNPNAPKGGEVRLHDLGTFDSLNQFIVKGVPAAGLALLFDTLLTPSADEPFTVYGLIAQTIEVPDDRSWVIFTLRPEARFHDGKPILAEDVVFTFETLRAKGAPFYRLYYAGVDKAEVLAERKLRFTFKPGVNRELPLIVGQMPVLSKASWQKRDFESTTLEAPLGSGPYRVEALEAGRYITYKRDPTYWAQNLPVRKGINNFDRLRYDYYRDSTVALEALKAGEYDLRPENESKKWATEYDFPAIAAGLVKKESLPHRRPTGMQAFVMNQRRPLFQDRRVRQALAYGFDFEWSNKNLFYGQYKRNASYFSNSELAARGLPSAEEMGILERFRGRLPNDVFIREYAPPATDGSGNIRDNLRIGLDLLKSAGWEIRDRKLVEAKTGKPFAFEILLNSPAFERVALPFAENLKRLGIEASVRTVDTAQYKNRTDSFDFDIVVDVWGTSESPGNEQREYWGSAAADMKGSRNSPGIKDKAIDELIDLVIAAPDREALVTRSRALDRALLWGHYVIPHWYIDYDRVAYWDKFGRPEVIPKQGYQFNAWWVDKAKAEAVTKRRQTLKK